MSPTTGSEGGISAPTPVNFNVGHERGAASPARVWRRMEASHQKLNEEERMMGAIESGMLRSALANCRDGAPLHINALGHSPNGGYRNQRHRCAHLILALSTRRLKITREGWIQTPSGLCEFRMNANDGSHIGSLMAPSCIEA
ncbi:unnamed protein product [Peronospora effusa]|nr:unnamed protein product [Peronospora effusa]